jgi:hypothetical protein
MIRVSVMANDSLVVDEIASILAQEIALDVLQLTYCLPSHMHEYVRDHDSVFVLIDDGETATVSRSVPWMDWDTGPLLLLKATFKAIQLDVYQGFPLTELRREQVTNLIREFGRSYLKSADGTEAAWVI